MGALLLEFGELPPVVDGDQQFPDEQSCQAEEQDCSRHWQQHHQNVWTLGTVWWRKEVINEWVYAEKKVARPEEVQIQNAVSSLSDSGVDIVFCRSKVMWVSRFWRHCQAGNNKMGSWWCGVLCYLKVIRSLKGGKSSVNENCSIFQSKQYFSFIWALNSKKLLVFQFNLLWKRRFIPNYLFHAVVVCLINSLWHYLGTILHNLVYLLATSE